MRREFFQWTNGLSNNQHLFIRHPSRFTLCTWHRQGEGHRFFSVLTDEDTDEEDKPLKHRQPAAARCLPVRWKIVLGDRAMVMTGRNRGQTGRVMYLNELAGYLRLKGCLLVSQWEFCCRVRVEDRCELYFEVDPCVREPGGRLSYCSLHRDLTKMVIRTFDSLKKPFIIQELH